MFATQRKNVRLKKRKTIVHKKGAVDLWPHSAAVFNKAAPPAKWHNTPFHLTKNMRFLTSSWDSFFERKIMKLLLTCHSGGCLLRAPTRASTHTV